MPVDPPRDEGRANVETLDEITCPTCGQTPFVSLDGDVVPCCVNMPTEIVKALKDLVDPTGTP